MCGAVLPDFVELGLLFRLELIGAGQQPAGELAGLCIVGAGGGAAAPTAEAADPVISLRDSALTR